MGILFNKNVPFKFKEMILDFLEMELQKYWAIEYDYALTEDNIDDWIDFVYRAILSKRNDEDGLNKLIQKFLDERIIENE